MKRLSVEHRAVFARAASAALATRERMELIRERAEGRPDRESLPLDPTLTSSVIAHGAELMRAMATVLADRPDVAGFRFRGHLFVLVSAGGGRAVAAVPEAAVLDVEG